ncbi:Metal homeostasis factor ATX1 [Grifola frondosa]|uniref:Metal homeostasis factor ATX1 n=1 Tax=Grifola frondosa TaxID=5627 RepID=A0A1C7MFK8_GRIFR|nr:Metal homeostasis factor ATX1 [Grifola frondosa]
MSEHTYKFDVKMTCTGCSGAVERVLKKTEGRWLFTAIVAMSTHLRPWVLQDLEKQEVLVKGTIPYDDLLVKIQKTGKEVRGGANGALRD